MPGRWRRPLEGEAPKARRGWIHFSVSTRPLTNHLCIRITGGDAATEWNAVMATAILAMLPPALVVILMQRWFVKGLVDMEK